MSPVDESVAVAGLVLAGGYSSRMGTAKHSLVLGGRTLLSRSVDLLEAEGLPTRVSLRPDQLPPAPSAGYLLVFDLPGVAGPAAGLLATWAADAGAALLVLAVDMPLVNRDLIRELLAGRDPSRMATAFVQTDGTPEPLCAIWEPRARSRIADRARQGAYSLRELLETGDIERLEPSAPERLRSINTPAQFEAVRATVDGPDVP